MPLEWDSIGQKLYIGLALNFLVGIVISLTRGADYDYRSISRFAKKMGLILFGNIEYVQFETKTKQIKQSETPVDEMVMGEKRIHLGYIRILS